MSDPRSRRIMKEIQDIEKDTLSQTSVEMVSPSDLMHLKGTFRGPPDTPYAGGKFTVDIKISSDYPFRAPKMKFDTKSLLECPEPSDPQDAEVAKHYLNDIDGFNETARYWTETYAEGVAGAYTISTSKVTKKSGLVTTKEADLVDLYGLDRDSVSNLMGMGFSQARVVEVMRRIGVRSMSNETQVDMIMAELLR